MTKFHVGEILTGLMTAIRDRAVTITISPKSAQEPWQRPSTLATRWSAARVVSTTPTESACRGANRRARTIIAEAGKRAVDRLANPHGLSAGCGPCGGDKTVGSYQRMRTGRRDGESSAASIATVRGSLVGGGARNNQPRAWNDAGRAGAAARAGKARRASA